MEVKLLGNIYGEQFGTGFAGNVWAENGICPTLMNMQGGGRQPMIVEANAIRMVRTEEGKALRKEYESGAIHHGFNEHREMELRTDGVSNTLSTVQKDNYICEKSIVAMRGRNPNNPSDRTVGSPTEQRLEPNSQGICNTLTSVQKDNLVMEKVVIDDTYANRQPRVYEDYSPALRSEREGLKTIENVYDFYNNNLKSDGVYGTLTTNSNTSFSHCGTFGVIEPQYRIRKLTPRECWRLMDFTDEDFEKAAQVNSNTQLYKQAGNSIVKNVLVAILGQMIPGKEDVYKKLETR